MRVHREAKHHLELAVKEAEKTLNTTVPGQRWDVCLRHLIRAVAHFIIGASDVFVNDPENRLAEARLAAQRKRRLG